MSMHFDDVYFVTRRGLIGRENFVGVDACPNVLAGLAFGTPHDAEVFRVYWANKQGEPADNFEIVAFERKKVEQQT